MVALVLFQTLVRETIYSFIAPDCGNQAPITVITAWHAASSFTHSGRDSVSPVGIAALYMVLVRAQQDNANVSLFKLWKAMWTPVVTFRLYALIIIPAPKYWLSLWSQLVKKETWKCRYLKKHLTLVMVQIMDLFLAVYSLIYVPVPSRKLSYLLSFFFFWTGRYSQLSSWASLPAMLRKPRSVGQGVVLNPGSCLRCMYYKHFDYFSGPK